MSRAQDPIRVAHHSVRALQILAAAIIVGSVWLAMSESLRNPFVEWDDQIAIVTNPNIREISPRTVLWMFTTFHLGPYQPVAWLSLAADHAVWGLNPFGFHLTSLIIHAVNALLVFVLTMKCLEVGISRPASLPSSVVMVLAGTVGSLCFAIHPQRVESVAWATERRDLLCGLFTLATVILWLAHSLQLRAASVDRDHERPVRTTKYYYLSLCAFVFALFSKASVIGMPFVLLIVDVFCLRRAPSDARIWWTKRFRRVLIEKLPFVAVAIVFAAIALVGQHRAQAVRSVEDVGFVRPMAIAVYATAFYLVKMIVPTSLSPLYEAPPELSGLAYRIVGAAAMVLLVTVAAVRWVNRRPLLLATWLAYLILIAPVCGIVSIGTHLAADRYTYVANIPWAILGATGIAALLRQRAGISKRRARVAWGAGITGAAAVLCTLGSLTAAQVRVWNGSFALWNHVIAVDPKSAIAHYGRGVARWRAGEEAAAIADYLEAIRLNPDYSDAHNNLGAIFATRGDLSRAQSHFLAAAAAHPENSVAHLNLGIIAGKQGRIDDAERHYRQALETRPEMLSARLNLAQLLTARGDPGAARRILEDGLPFSPSDSTLRRQLEKLRAVE